MIFTETPLAGAWIVDPEPREDNRGLFARAYCTQEFAARGLHTVYPQHNISRSTRRGTLRGMHFQNPPHAEAKLIRCTRGAIYDVIVDIREGSPSFRRWHGVELDARGLRQLYVPEGFAHGFITLTDDVEVTYLNSHAYAPGAEGGLRYDDPGIGVAWPVAVTEISERDTAWPLV
jgi:dTDP-4-dehydrorhamnose 3,5-epimerase